MQRTPSRLAAEIADRYAVERELGRGGTAIVYLARDRESGEMVALKVLRAELVESLTAERFLREIRVTQQFSHPNIVPVLGSGVADGTFYCVLAYMDGGTLRDRLAREKQLPLRDVSTIGRAIGAALEYAHARKIIHRDVKPENILFSSGQACLADFGIARALESAGDTSTSTGIVRGTPAYMSPEQASGEREYDGRSDCYSLACALYEALAGTPAFVGANSQAVLAQRLIHVPRPLRVYRPTATPELEGVLARALAIAPADRYQTATEFTHALCSAIDTPAATTASAPSGIADRAKHPARPWLWASVAALGVVVLVYARAGPLADYRSRGAAAPLDTTRYAVLPFDYSSDVPAKLNERQLFQDALLAWSGVTLADRVKLEAAMASRNGAPLTSSEAASIARQAGAGRYLRGEVSRAADSLRLRVALYDAVPDHDLLAEATTKVSLSGAGLQSAAQGLTDRVLLREAGSSPQEVGLTRSLPARQAWLEGERALDSWKLDAADSGFARAMVFDTGFARPALWLALVRSWNGEPLARWTAPLVRAASQPSRLTAREASIASGLQAGADKAWDRAASVWRALTSADRTDFVAWFGLANCLAKDHAVIPDRNVSSGWRFRSSAQEIVSAYRRAFELHPGTQNGGFDLLRDLVYTKSDQLRIGGTVPGGEMMLAEPGWAGDTLVFIPYPASGFIHNVAGSRGSSRREALLRERHLLNEISASWVAAAPASPPALEALAYSLRLLGDPSALDTLRRARSLAVADADRVRLAAAEAWFRVTAALPDDTTALQQMRALADSLLQHSNPRDAAALQGVAALLGRAGLAATLGGAAGVGRDAPTVRSLVRDAPALLAYAAMGGPVDSLRRLESAITVAINATALAEERARARQEWLQRAARIAFPDAQFAGLQALAKEGDPLLEAEAALARNDPGPARRYLASLPAVRANWAPEEIAPEALYPEARLFQMLGDTAHATAWLDPMLAAIGRIDPQVLAQVPNAAALVRCMVLRADRAAESGDSVTATRWARSVVILWSGADPFLQPTVHRMERIARTSLPNRARQR